MPHPAGQDKDKPCVSLQARATATLGFFGATPFIDLAPCPDRGTRVRRVAVACWPMVLRAHSWFCPQDCSWRVRGLEPRSFERKTSALLLSCRSGLQFCLLWLRCLHCIPGECGWLLTLGAHPRVLMSLQGCEDFCSCAPLEHSLWLFCLIAAQAVPGACGTPEIGTYACLDAFWVGVRHPALFLWAPRGLSLGSLSALSLQPEYPRQVCGRGQLTPGPRSHSCWDAAHLAWPGS